MGLFDSQGFYALIERLDRVESLILEKNETSPAWLDLNQASQYARLSKKTLRRAIQAGKLRSVRRAGKLLFRMEWLDKFILYGKQRITGPERAGL